MLDAERCVDVSSLVGEGELLVSCVDINGASPARPLADDDVAPREEPPTTLHLSSEGTVGGPAAAGGAASPPAVRWGDVGACWSSIESSVIRLRVGVAALLAAGDPMSSITPFRGDMASSRLRRSSPRPVVAPPSRSLLLLPVGDPPCDLPSTEGSSCPESDCTSRGGGGEGTAGGGRAGGDDGGTWAAGAGDVPWGFGLNM
mmetsp:Transcript_40673/g.101707  ORF Transcript_40673/g.101707 Transcript_40673/m.101707 type:complete len:202 (-) Transcript_40673:1610-2215(-)